MSASRFTGLIALLLALLLMPAAVRAESADPLAGEWLVLGPLPNLVANGECQGFVRDLLAGSNGVASEATVKPFAGMACAGGTWVPVQVPKGRIDFLSILGTTENAIAYACHNFESPAAQSLALKVGSDDGIKIWLNGMPVLSNHIHRALLEYSETVVIKLQAGTNHLVVKVDQGVGSWEFSLKLRTLAEEAADAAKNPASSINLSVDRPFLTRQGTIHGLVSTNPSWALADPVTLTLSSGNGQVLASSSARPGQSFDLPLDKAWTGMLVLQAAGSGSLARLPAVSRNLYIGDREELRSRMLITARARSLAASGTAAWTSTEDILAATWQFLGDQIDGRLDPALVSTEREERAILSAARLGNMPASARLLQASGLHQWAYRSPIDGSIQPFSLYVPAGYDPAKKYRLALWLHGFGGNDWDAARTLADAAPADFIILAPFGRGSIGYQGPGEQDVIDLMDLVQRNLSVDPDRIYLAGNSMGGMGTWRIGQFFAGRFAAIAPFCGWTPTDWLPNLISVPTLIVHGDADQVVPIGPDRNAWAWLAAAGSPVRFDTLPGAGHDAWQAWTKGASAEKLLSWFRPQIRNNWPDRFTIKLVHARYGQRPWARLAGLVDPGTPGSLTVERLDERHLAITTSNVASFDLRLDHPRLARTGRLVLSLDGQSRTLDAGNTMVRLDRDPGSGKWSSTIQAGSLPASARPAIVSHDGGGVADLFFRPLYLVYGTQDKNRTTFWKNAAEILAMPWGLRVVSDVALSQTMMESASLFLFGSATENSVSARLAKALPVAWVDGSVRVAGQRFDNAAALQTCPNPLAPGNLVTIYSNPVSEADGLAFCRGLASSLQPYGRGGDDTTSFTLPDILIMQAGLRPVWSASFDRDWSHLAPAIAKK